jgi:hypothetical protein
MRPRGLIGPVFAMARPRRPPAEANLVRAAADGPGCASQRALRLAARVAKATLADVDAVETDPVLVLLHALALNPVHQLATDPEIDTAALFRAERAKRADARGGRRLPEREWAAEDREIMATITAALARRYRGALGK